MSAPATPTPTPPTTPVTFSDVARFIWGHLKKKPLGLAIALLGVALAMLPDILMPTFTTKLSEGLVKGNMNEALWGCAGIFSCTIAFIVLWYGTYNQFCMKLIDMNIVIETEAFLNVQRASTDWHINNFAGKTMHNIFRGSRAFETLVTTLIENVFSTAILVIGMVAMMWFKWPLMGLAATLSFTTYIITLHIFTKHYLSDTWKGAVEQDKLMRSMFSDSLSCNAAVKTFGRELTEYHTLIEKKQPWAVAVKKSWSRQMGYDALVQVLSLINQFALLGVPLYLWHVGQAGPEIMVYGLTVFYQMSGPLRGIGNSIDRLKQAVIDLEDLIRFEELPKALADVAGAKEATLTAGEIDVQSITFSYPSQKEKPIYKGLSLHIAGGERVGLVGTSGSGKSTLVKLIQRLYDLDAGHILIDGQDIALVQQSSLRRQIALVPQDPVLFHRSLLDNIRYAKPDATEAEVIKAATMAHAHDFIAKLPEGYNTLVGERGVKLSGGERQRVAIARAILADAPILVLDEATSSLDSVSESLIQDALDSLMQDRTTLIVAHRLSTLRAVDRILVFDNGEIVESGPHDALMAIPNGRYKQLYETQQLKGFAETDLEAAAG